LASPDRGGELCLRCGLCCNGTLFTHVPLEPDEAQRVRDRGVPVDLSAEGSSSIRQCCSALRGTRCSIYEDRPGACRRYRCLLLCAVEEDEVSLKEALRVVDEARQLLGRLDDALEGAGPEEAGSVTHRARLAHRPDQGSALPAEAKRQMRETEAFLDKHFRGRHGR
jgi:Fe-S-cluster containining protein